MLSNTRIKVVRGSDESFVLKLRTRSDRDPMDLTAATKISVIFIKSNRSELILTNEEISATKATLTIGGVIFLASEPGTLGNSIQLNFDGVKTVQELVDAWNLANVGNEVEFTGTANQIITGGIYTLKGGMPAYTPVEIIGNPILGKFRVKLIDYHTSQLRLGINQSITVYVDYGVHPTGERVPAELKNFLDVVEPN
jgi:hypothetical protein